MKTLIKSKEKLSIDFNNIHCSKQKGQYAITKNELDNKLYQKLFLAFFGCSIFLIFPESPNRSCMPPMMPPSCGPNACNNPVSID